MRINVYQIDGEDNARIKFENYKRTLELGGVDPSKYKCVFHGYVNAKTADDVYNIFNGFRDSNIGTYQGHSLSISDVVEIVDDIPEIYGKIDFLYAGEDHIGKVGDTVYYTDAEAFNNEIEESQDRGRPIKAEIIADQHMKLTEPGFYFCDSIGWQKIEFDKAQSAEMDGIRMLMILPHHPPVETYVKDELDRLQLAVSDHGEDALIEFTYPFDDDCIMLGNEEAKLNGMEGNRRIGNSIYAGPLYVTRDNGVGGLCSLTDEQVQKYSEMFAEPHDISPEETQGDVGFVLFGW